ncbi:hypothetical protein BJV82DRAFT_709237 [Fennellomyces sp. T-0311]|nr:hypothetical protein BJV82DRAFT_709237 [Fennellomyces sp. T-0311]
MSNPPCRCGRDSISCEVKKPGPNRGKWFWRCATQACGYFRWDTSASKFVVHPTNAYAQAQPHSTRRPYALTLNYDFTGTAPKPQKKTEIEFRLHSPQHISIRADQNPTLLPVLENMENVEWNDELQLWIIPATAQSYARALQQIPVAPNLNLEVTRLSNALRTVLQETTGMSEHTAFVREAESEEAIHKLSETKLWKTLKRFQRDGVRTILRRQGRAIVVDEPGMGRRLLALTVALAYQDDWPVLIVCPAESTTKWKELVREWMPVDSNDIHITTGKVNLLGKSASRKRKKHKGLSVNSGPKRKLRRGGSSSFTTITEDEDFSDKDQSDEEDQGVSLYSHHKFHIINYKLARKFQKQIQERHFRAVICDDAHNDLKYRAGSRQQRFLTEVLQAAPRLVMISEEFNLNKPFDLFTQLSVLRHDLFPEFHRYGKNYCNGKQEIFGWDYSGAKNQVELKYIVDNAICLKRTKEEVQEDLP